MKINRIITSVNANPTYLTFAPYMTNVWKSLHGITPTIAYIQSGNEDSDYIVQEYLSSHCDILVFPRIEQIDYGVQAKVTRMFLSAEYEDDYSVIADIDMIPMSTKFLESYSVAEDSHFVKFATDHASYSSNENKGKWQMHGTAAKGTTFRKIVNPEKLPYRDLLLSWKGFPQDPKSNIFNNFHAFSDESLLKCLFEQRGGKDQSISIKRTDVEGDYNSESAYGMLCRSRYSSINDVRDLKKYYECHGPRPFHRNLDWYNRLLK